MCKIKESDIEAYLVKRIEALGGEIRKLAWVGRRDAPDRFIALNGRVWLVEVKAPDADMNTPHVRAQKRENAKLSRVGVRVVWLSSFEEVDIFWPVP